jgi:glycosyltransferase involved in cell wall biosynthesis
MGRLRALVEELNLGQAVEFCGIIDDSPRFWGRCDLAVVPSEAPHIEACPMVVIEAMACGKAVIGTYNGGTPELIVPGQTGTLVPPADPHELALAMISYARDPGKTRSQGMAARSRCEEQFNIAECARAYLDLFTALLAPDRP